jgi:hypothetical protein
MRKALTLPIVAAMAANPLSGPLVGVGAVPPLAGLAALATLSGCGTKPEGGPAIDLTAIDLGATVTRLVKLGCGVEPLADTISAIAVALALPAATPIQQAAALVAKQICAQVQEARLARRAPLRSIAPDGRPAVSYGPVVINGHVIDVKVYQ